MRKRLPLFALILAVAALVVTPIVLAGPGGPGPGRHGFAGPPMAGGPILGIFGHLRHAQEELELTDAQVGQIKGIFAGLHEQNASVREQLHDGMGGAAKVLLADPNDLAGAQAALDRRTAARRVLETNVLQATAKALNVLTADQRTELSQLMAEHGGRRGRRGR